MTNLTIGNILGSTKSNRRRAKMKYEIYDQETGKRIGNTVKTTRAAERMVTLIHKKTGRCPDYRPVKEPLS